MIGATTGLRAGPAGPDLAGTRRRLGTLPARHQPPWENPELGQIRDQLAELPGLVSWREVHRLHDLLADVALGRRQVLQAGDCAEDPAECTAGHIARKAAMLDVLAGVMWLGTGKPVVRVGRIAGQFGKPRSRPTERVGGIELPVYRGHMVNGAEPDLELRTPDPKRLLAGYWAASAGMDAIHRHRQRSGGAPAEPAGYPPLWTSHEALLLDYELPMLRRLTDGRLLLTSTHWPWIGDRTRQVHGAHVAMLAGVANPVACKVGPGVTAGGPDGILALCARLDPHLRPGRLTLISRMGADLVAERLPPLVRAVRAAGHSAIWLCDPMHGNTIMRGDRKTRRLASMLREVRLFQEAVAGAGGVAGGLHLEATPDHVLECTDGPEYAEVPERAEAPECAEVLEPAEPERPDAGPAGPYLSLCDPRLNIEQATRLVSAWRC